MAVLSEANRRGLFADFMREMSNERQALPLSKADLRAAGDALDQFLSDNAPLINLAIPQPARGALSVAQKALLLLFAVRQRYLKGA